MPSAHVPPRPSSGIRAFSLALIACLAGPAAPRAAWAEALVSHAERDAEERAREAFQQGVHAAAHRNFARAAAEFELALQLRPTPSVEYNLAAALYEGQRYREAHGHLERVLRSPGVADEVRAGAEELEVALTQHVALLAVEFSTDTAQESSLLLDGQPVDAGLWGRPMALTAGGHTVELIGPSGRLAQKQVVLEVGRTTAVSLHLIAMPEAEKAPKSSGSTALPLGAQLGGPGASELPPHGSPKEVTPLRRSWKLWTTVGSVLVVGAGIGLGVALARRNGDAPKDSGDSLGPGVLTW